jgi:protein gp37
MAENTNIEWATHTWNPWLGCTKVSPGCYAETLMDDRYGKVKWGPHGTRVKTSDAYWRKPIAWEKAAAKSGEQVRVFPSLCDVFEDWPGRIQDSKGHELWLENGLEHADDGSQDFAYRKQPMTIAECRRDLFALIDATPHLTWLLLTKRPENIRRMWPRSADPISGGEYIEICDPRPNVWLGVSVENQEYADSRIPELLKFRDLSPVLWVSYEPALGPVDFAHLQYDRMVAMLKSLMEAK